MHLYVNVYTHLTTVQWEVRACSDHLPEPRYLASGSFYGQPDGDPHDLLEETCQQIIAAYAEIAWAAAHGGDHGHAEAE